MNYSAPFNGCPFYTFSGSLDRPTFSFSVLIPRGMTHWGLSTTFLISLCIVLLCHYDDLTLRDNMSPRSHNQCLRSLSFCEARVKFHSAGWCG